MGLFDRIRGGEDDPRVAFFGIDGVPYSLITDHPDEFEHLTKLIDDGSGGAIDSIEPPESSACWPALTAGVNPGETGIYGFQDREVGSYDTYVPMRRDFQATRIWDRVHAAGRKATVMNVVTTFPPQRDVQRMVSGFLSPSVDKAAYPDKFRDYLLGIDYVIDVNAGLGKQDKAAFIENAHETIDRRQEAFREYIKKDDWDLFFGVFMATDRVNHFLFRDYEEDGEHAEAFLEFYRKVDQYLGELRGMLDDDVTMVVASDHGFTTLDYEVNCNAWLREEGWLSFDSDDDYVFQLGAWLREGTDLEVDPDYAGDVDDLVDPSTLDIDYDDDVLVATSPEEREVAEEALHAASPHVLETEGTTATVVEVDEIDVDTHLVDDAEEYHVGPTLVKLTGSAYVDDGAIVALDEATKATVVDALDGATPASLGIDRADSTPLFDAVEVTETDAGYRIDLEAADGVVLGTDMDPDREVLEFTHSELGDISDETTAYSLIPGRFYINREGREPRGSVPDDEFEEVRAELKAELEALEGPDGEPVADRVVTKEEAFRGAHDAIAPDLVVVPNHGFDLKSGFKGHKDPFVEYGARNGMHSFDNATLVLDEDDVRLSDVDLYDIAPTILDLMEIDFERSEFDGSSLV